MQHLRVWASGIAAVFYFFTAHAIAEKNVANDFLQIDTIVEHKFASNHVRLFARAQTGGEYLVIVPSLGRGVEDYTEQYHSSMTTQLVQAGYRVVLIQPRGIGQSGGDLAPANASMSLFAQDIKAVLDALNIQQAHFIGHAFGNRLVRTFSTLYPAYVDGLVLMASGGDFELSAEQKHCLRQSFNLLLNDEKRLEFIQCAFFAKGNDPSVWLSGWYPKLAKAQIVATQMINGDFFKKAGGKPFLLIQALEDFIAPPDKAGRLLKHELGEQVTYVEIPNAGHALSAEQSDLVVKHIVGYLQK